MRSKGEYYYYKGQTIAISIRPRGRQQVEKSYYNKKKHSITIRDVHIEVHVHVNWAEGYASESPRHTSVGGGGGGIGSSVSWSRGQKLGCAVQSVHEVNAFKYKVQCKFSRQKFSTHCPQSLFLDVGDRQIKTQSFIFQITFMTSMEEIEQDKNADNNETAGVVCRQPMRSV